MEVKNMLSFISFLLVIIGAFNWFTIGLLQYDFVAGLFGSQANVFSRLIYALVGIASIVVIFNMIKNKGRFIVSFRKANDEYEEYKEEKREKEAIKNARLSSSYESAEDFYNIKKEGETYDKTAQSEDIDYHDKDIK